MKTCMYRIECEMLIIFLNKYTIYIHCRKIYYSFVRTLETGEEASAW